MKAFYSKKFPVFGTYAMLILCMVCFLLPFALRGARLAITSMQNNVADWLPSDYEETQDLEEFRKYFVGDQFVFVSGPWCQQGNNNFINFVRKLREESLEYESELKETGRLEELRAHQKGDELGLLYTGDYHETWGEQRERWLRGKKGQWYWINRNGQLFRWDGQNNFLQGMSRFFERQVHGRNKATGTYIDTFGEPPDDQKGIENEFYADPLKLCARPFKSVTTGPDVFQRMAGSNGTRRIGLFDEDDATSFATQIKTHQLLTGSLFGPTPDESFRWTFESLLQQVDKPRRDELQSNDIYRDRFRKFVEYERENRFDGSFEQLLRANPEVKLELWYRMWDAIELEPPPRQTCIIATLNEPVLNELDRVVGRPILGKPRGRILELATGRCGIKPENLHIGGPPADNVAIDEEGTTTLLRLVNLSAIIGIGLAYISFRSIRITFMLFFVGGVSAISSLAYVWFGGSTLDAILMSMPSLVYVLGLSGAVHIVNYYRDACRETGPATAAEVAVQHGWFPCTLAAFTTALGLVSLYTSQLVPIQKFGLFSAIATLATVVLLFTFLPAALTIWPPGFRRREDDEPEQSSWVTTLVTNSWMRIGNWVIQHNLLVVTVSVILMAFFAYGVSQIKTSVHLLKLFDQQAKILQDYRWLEQNIGKLVPMELVICVDDDAQQEQYLKEQAAISEKRSDANSDEASEPVDVQYDKLAYDLKYSMLERMELSNRVRTKLELFFGPTGLDIVGPGMSTDVFAPIELIETQLHPGTSLDAKFSRRLLFEEQLSEKRNQMVEEDYLAVGGITNVDPIEALADTSDPKRAGREMWRVSLRLEALNDVDYGDFVTNIKSVVEPIMTAYQDRTKILTRVQQQLGVESLNSGRIVVLGRNPDRIAASHRDPGEETDNILEMVDQTYIFSDTLQDLLENRSFANYGKKDKPYRDKWYRWVDPTVIDPSNRSAEELSRSFVDLIKNSECVVLIEDHPLFDVELIKEHAKEKFVDCRDHIFEIDPATNMPEPGVLTAMQRIKKQEDLDIGTIYTGVIPIVYKAQNQLLKSLVKSIALAFVMIAFVMMLLLRNWRESITVGNLLNIPGGMLSMLPNVFPIVIIFGAMGHLDIAVDIGSMMTASVAMGVAVDDTIHFLNWYRQGLASGRSRLESIRLAYQRVATAMSQTTLIGGLGLSAFALSTFTPTQKFGILMLLLLAAALVGDLILLPAILASPLGRFFGKERKQGNPDANVGEAHEPSVPVIHEFEQTGGLPTSARPPQGEDLPDIHPDSLRHVKRRGPD